MVDHFDRSTWILFVKDGPNIDAGTTAFPEDAMAEVDEAAKSKRTRDAVAEWRRRDGIPFGSGKLRIRPHLRQR